MLFYCARVLYCCLESRRWTRSTFWSCVYCYIARELLRVTCVSTASHSWIAGHSATRTRATYASTPRPFYAGHRQQPSASPTVRCRRLPPRVVGPPVLPLVAVLYCCAWLACCRLCFRHRRVSCRRRYQASPARFVDVDFCCWYILAVDFHCRRASTVTSGDTLSASAAGALQPLPTVDVTTRRRRFHLPWTPPTVHAVIGHPSPGYTGR